MNKNFESRNRDMTGAVGTVGVVLVGGILLGLLLVDGVQFLSNLSRLYDDDVGFDMDIIKLMSMYFGGM